MQEILTQGNMGTKKTVWRVEPSVKEMFPLFVYVYILMYTYILIYLYTYIYLYIYDSTSRKSIRIRENCIK